jgi:hypothetical protein
MGRIVFGHKADFARCRTGRINDEVGFDRCFIAQFGSKHMGGLIVADYAYHGTVIDSST